MGLAAGQERDPLIDLLELAQGMVLDGRQGRGC